MVEKLDGFDLKGDGGGKNDDGIGDDTLDWMRLLFGDIDDENNEIVLETNQIIRETPKKGYEQIASKNEGDLMAKCYFIKKKLVWEFLQGRLKYKIEIQWSDISEINAVMEKNQPGILQIELNRPPTFHEEIDPQPRKQAIWKLAKDFTGRQASIFSEPRFFKLSKQSFPTLKNPFFHSISRGNPGSAFDYNHRGQDFNLRMQFNFPNFLSHVGQTQHIQPYGHIGNSVQPYGHNDQEQPYGHRGM
ncbi:hypothetical protein D5086_009742, partial [Populus alba]